MIQVSLVKILTSCSVVAIGFLSSAAQAETPSVTAKPAMYTYFASWVFPRGRWPEADKATPSLQKILESAVAGGQITGFGDDAAIVHQTDAPTHDDWWSGNSLAAILDVLDAEMKGAPSPLLASATAHTDQILVSHFYNWRPGKYTGAYTHTAVYKLKADAPNDAVESISKACIAPLMEKLLAEGTIIEYEVDEEAVHTSSPDYFHVDFVTPTSAGLDKVNTALADAVKGDPMVGPALDSMVESPSHRDYLFRSNATYR